MAAESRETKTQLSRNLLGMKVSNTVDNSDVTFVMLNVSDVLHLRVIYEYLNLGVVRIEVGILSPMRRGRGLSLTVKLSRLR